MEANLEGAFISRAHLEGADLRDAHLEGAYLAGAHLDGAMLNRAHLKGADLWGAHLDGADLREADFTEVNVSGLTYDRRNMKCQGIRVATCFGNALFKRDAEDQDWIETFRRRSRWNRILCLPWAFFTDCGRSLLRVALMGACIAVFFGKVYELQPHLLDTCGSAQTPWTPYYYSIVTFTTLGFGDVTPASFAGELWVGAEVLVGYLMLGLLVSILANKVARRS